MPTKSDKPGSSGTILDKMKAALNADGDFPVRTRVVTELRSLATNPRTPVSKISELILTDPSLGTRILHLVNSSFYRRSVGGVFANNVKKCILTSILTSMLVKESETEKEAEKGYLAGTFFGIGTLLLSYYFPQVCESAAQRAQARRHSLARSIRETLGLSPLELSLGIVDSLSIPEFYKELLSEAHALQTSEAETRSHIESSFMAKALVSAGMLADALVDSTDRKELVLAIREAAQCITLPLEQTLQIVKKTPLAFAEHCQLIDMSFLTLAEHVDHFAEEDETYLEEAEAPDEIPGNERFAEALEQIREAISYGETMSSIITSVMEILAFSLNYDRVLLLQSDLDRSYLSGKMALGKPFKVSPKDIRRPLVVPDIESAPDVHAFVEGTVQIFGEPLFEDGWPFAAIPIGNGSEALGVIYADRLSRPDSAPLDSGSQLALGLLADLLDEAIASGA